MKNRILICLSVAAMICTSAQAWVGGPFSNNSFNSDGGVNGTYQGILRGKNVTGVFIMGTSATVEIKDTGLRSTSRRTSLEGGIRTTTETENPLTQLTGNEGRFAMFVKGTVVAGSTTASVDMSGRKISAILEGSRNRGTQAINKQGIESVVSGSNGLSYYYSNKGYELKDVLYVAGDFNAKVNKSYPSQSFLGSGEIEISDPTGIEEVVISSGKDIFGYNTSTTKIVPKIEKTEVKIRVNAVKTSNLQPAFPTGLTVEYPSVTTK